MFHDIQIVIITKFVVVSSVGIKGVTVDKSELSTSSTNN